MPAPAQSDDRETLRNLVKEINRAWRSGRTDDLNRNFRFELALRPKA